MIRRPILLLLIFVAVLMLSGCALNTLAQKNMEYDITMLQQKVADMEGNFSSKLNKSIEMAVKEVDSNYQKSIETSLRNQAGIEADIETLRLDFRRVKGDVEDVAHKADRSLTENNLKIADYDMRLRDLELEVAKINGRLDTLENNQKLFLLSSRATSPATGETPVTEEASTTGEAPTVGGTSLITDVTPELAALPVPDAAVTPVVVATTDTATEEKKIPDEVQAEFDSALSAFKEGRFDDAMALFAAFIEKNPGTEITDNAQYWVAECYYKKKEFDKAILEYDKMVATYPKSDKVPSALLKEGFSFLQLNYKDEAIMKLNKLIADHPDTNQAEIARRKLKVLE